MRRREQPDFSPALPITQTPANHPSLSQGATLVKVALLEGAGAGINHLFDWPWWIGSQLAVAYLFWRLMHERAFYTSIVVAWNKRLDGDRKKP